MKNGTMIDNRKKRIVFELRKKGLSKEKRKELVDQLRNFKLEEYSVF
jgi:hypothetical protein